MEICVILWLINFGMAIIVALANFFSFSTGFLFSKKKKCDEEQISERSKRKRTFIGRC